MLKGILELWLDYAKGCGLILVALIVKDGFFNATLATWIALTVSISLAFSVKVGIYYVQKREGTK